MPEFADPFADHGSWEYEPASGIGLWSPSMYRIFGVAPGEFVPDSSNIMSLVHPDDREMVAGVAAKAAETHAPFACQYRIVRPDGEVRTVLSRGSVIESAAGTRLLGILQDVTGRDGEEEKLWHLANHDSLTGLFNRRRFMDELQREISFSRRTATDGAVLMLDLDRFKDINDSLGHAAGDELLQRVAEQLRSRLRATDTLARLGGDEFALVLPDCTAADAERIAQELLGAVRSQISVRLGGVGRGVTGSIGVATFGPAHERSADRLLVEADLAMYRAKAAGRGRVEAFDEELRAELAARVTLEGELREALRRDELVLHYQPIVALADGITVGCEALLRWRHPSRGLVPPAEFIPIAEETGLIAEIGRFALDRACAEAARWRRAGKHAYVAVNVSPLQLIRDDIIGDVAAALRSSGLPAPLLCLEITRASMLDDPAPLGASLRELKRLGVRISIDDFGDGASSLGLLRTLALDQIKIDRTFVAGIAEHSNDRAIVAAALSLAHELGLSVVAEGVETERQQAELLELGAEYAQGFLYAAPAGADELALDGHADAIRQGLSVSS